MIAPSSRRRSSWCAAPGPDCLCPPNLTDAYVTRQLTPYTVLTVKEFEASPNLEVQPHRIVVRVAPDNKALSETLPVAPWS